MNGSEIGFVRVGEGEGFRLMFFLVFVWNS